MGSAAHADPATASEVVTRAKERAIRIERASMSRPVPARCRCDCLETCRESRAAGRSMDHLGIIGGRVRQPLVAAVTRVLLRVNTAEIRGCSGPVAGLYRYA